MKKAHVEEEKKEAKEEKEQENNKEAKKRDEALQQAEEIVVMYLGATSDGSCSFCQRAESADGCCCYKFSPLQTQTSVCLYQQQKLK